MAYWSHVGEVDFLAVPTPKDSRGIKGMGKGSLTPNPRHLGGEACLSPLELKDGMLAQASLPGRTCIQPASPQPSLPHLVIPIPHTQQISLSVNPKCKARKHKPGNQQPPALDSL